MPLVIQRQPCIYNSGEIAWPTAQVYAALLKFHCNSFVWHLKFLRVPV